MGVDDFLNSAADEVDAILGTVVMTCDGQTFPVVWNDDRKALDGALGGLDADVSAQAVAQAGDVTNPRSLIQKRATVDGRTYRISEVMTGSVAVTFTLSDINSST